MEVLKQREKEAAIALIKAQKALMRAMINVQNASEQKAASKQASPKRPPKKQRSEEESVAMASPVKKARIWKCMGNVLLGADNPGCQHPNAEEAPVTRVKGKGVFDTCKECKRDIARIRKAQKKETKDASPE